MSALDDFLDALSKWNLRLDQTRGIETALRRLSDNELPVVLDFGQLAEYLGVQDELLADIINRSNGFYRNFNIAKRTGGSREIAVPKPSLMAIQRVILTEILEKIDVHYAAHGFIKGKGILSNASQHLGCGRLLKMDIKDFFPSISLPRVIGMFRQFGYPLNAAFYLASICCLNGKLPQGAPTSPYVSNIIARKLDNRLFSLASAKGAKYTRYADDIAISGFSIEPSWINFVSEIVRGEGFEINGRKTHFIWENSRKIVTGIVVNGLKPRLPRAFKKSVRQEIYYLEKFGVISSSERLNLDPLYLEQLQGRVSYLALVEGQSDVMTHYMEAIAVEKQILDGEEL
ncbi:reverse transcriptase family protein [Emcibacter sp. SYSU 3D8]|uniref:reverse transcriptase family protein n=1 Tax=Emcibacter sp. SYSU 3D8 TaxID=3133969 RepID=UPI0031FF1B12